MDLFERKMKTGRKQKGKKKKKKKRPNSILASQYHYFHNQFTHFWKLTYCLAEGLFVSVFMKAET